MNMSDYDLGSHVGPVTKYPHKRVTFNDHIHANSYPTLIHFRVEYYRNGVVGELLDLCDPCYVCSLLLSRLQEGALILVIQLLLC